MKNFICSIISLAILMGLFAIFMGLLYLGIANYDLFAQYKCKFCGSREYGYGCEYSPYANKVHEHTDIGDYKECAFCGRSPYGHGCNYSPFDHKHKHHADGVHCRWCGIAITPIQRGGDCKDSPTEMHEF